MLQAPTPIFTTTQTHINVWVQTSQVLNRLCTAAIKQKASEGCADSLRGCSQSQFLMVCDRKGFERCKKNKKLEIGKKLLMKRGRVACVLKTSSRLPHRLSFANRWCVFAALRNRSEGKGTCLEKSHSAFFIEAHLYHVYTSNLSNNMNFMSAVPRQKKKQKKNIQHHLLLIQMWAGW